MASIAKWLAILIPAFWLGSLGVASAANNSSMIVVNCFHLDAIAPESKTSADIAYFRVAHEPFNGFAPGPKAQAQGVFLASELVRSSAVCDVNGKKAMIRVVNYQMEYRDCPYESYQVEIWVDSVLRFRSAKPNDCGTWGATTFEGTIEVGSAGYITVCSDDLGSVGQLAPPDMSSNGTGDPKVEQLRLEHSNRPTGPSATAFYERACG